ncbi:MAG: hypothetical protein ACR2H1_08400 [Limisphaerales bacterium]
MNSRTIEIISVLLNLGLLAAVGFVFTKNKPAAVVEKISQNMPENKLRFFHKFPKKTSAPKNISATPSSAKEFSWNEIESEDFKTYIAQLRAVECPEETIREIIVADVNKLYAPKLQKIRGTDGPQNYWKANRNAGRRYYAEQRDIRAIEKEKSKLLIELLGVDPNEELRKENFGFNFWDRQFEFLSEDKKEKMREVADKYEGMKEEIYRTAIWDEEDMKKVREIEKQQLAEMAQTLTPQELEEFQLRRASELRNNLDGFSPSENEFREIFKIQKAHEDELVRGFDSEDKAAQERQKKVVEQMNAEMKRVLGESRFAEYERAQDYQFKELTRLTDKLELPKEAAVTVYEMKKEVETAAQQIRTNQTLTSAQRTEALKKIRYEAEKTALDALGETGLKKYKTRSGWWFNNISPDSTRPKTVVN